MPLLFIDLKISSIIKNKTDINIENKVKNHNKKKGIIPSRRWNANVKKNRASLDFFNIFSMMIDKGKP